MKRAGDNLQCREGMVGKDLVDDDLDEKRRDKTEELDEKRRHNDRRKNRAVLEEFLEKPADIEKELGLCETGIHGNRLAAPEGRKSFRRYLAHLFLDAVKD